MQINIVKRLYLTIFKSPLLPTLKEKKETKKRKKKKKQQKNYIIYNIIDIESIKRLTSKEECKRIEQDKRRKI